jgi:hypothetical protein
MTRPWETRGGLVEVKCPELACGKILKRRGDESSQAFFGRLLIHLYAAHDLDNAAASRHCGQAFRQEAT